MPILLYITMWSCALAMTSALAPAVAPLEREGAQRASGPRD
jgi:hypothetical protein